MASSTKKAAPARAAKKGTTKKATPATKQSPKPTRTTTTKPSTTRKPAVKKATAPKAQPRAKAVTYKTDPKAFLERVVDLTGLTGIDVQMHDETAGVIVHEVGRLTYSFIPNPAGSRWDVEVSSADDAGQMPDAGPVIVASKLEDVAAGIVKAVMGSAAPSKMVPPAQKRSTAKVQRDGKVSKMTQAEYDRQIAQIDGSDLGSRFKAAAKAVLTKKARESGLTVAGARKATEGMSRDEISQRRSDAAKRAVETRRANEAAKAAEAAKAVKKSTARGSRASRNATRRAG